jgi:hypothetical protein
MYDRAYTLRRSAGNYLSLAMVMTDPNNRAAFLAMAQQLLDRSNHELENLGRPEQPLKDHAAAGRRSN